MPPATTCTGVQWKTYNDVRELNFKDINSTFSDNGVNVKSLSVESKIWKLCSIFKKIPYKVMMQVLILLAY